MVDSNLNVEMMVVSSSSPSIELTKTYHDDYAVPILVGNYEAGDTFTITITYKWNAGTAVANIPKDYTVSVYS